MPQSTINRINYMAKKQKSVKGIKFCDRQHVIDDNVRTGVIDDLKNVNSHHNVFVENEPNDADNIVLDIFEEDDVVISDEIDDHNHHTDVSQDSEDVNEASSENRDYEFVQPHSITKV